MYRTFSFSRYRLFFSILAIPVRAEGLITRQTSCYVGLSLLACVRLSDSIVRTY